jgi:hypothetical protein
MVSLGPYRAIVVGGLGEPILGNGGLVWDGSERPLLGSLS